MKRRFLGIVISGIIVLVAVGGCRKSKETKLIGEWELIQLSGSDLQYSSIVWDFTEDNQIIINKTDTAGFITNTDTALYELKSKSFKYYLVIDSISKYEDGLYHIEKLTKDAMVLQCQDPYIRREMLKK